MKVVRNVIVGVGLVVFFPLIFALEAIGTLMVLLSVKLSAITTFFFLGEETTNEEREDEADALIGGYSLKFSSIESIIRKEKEKANEAFGPE